MNLKFILINKIFWGKGGYLINSSSKQSFNVDDFKTCLFNVRVYARVSLPSLRHSCAPDGPLQRVEEKFTCGNFVSFSSSQDLEQKVSD